MVRAAWAKYVWLGNGILALLAGLLLLQRGGFPFPAMLGVLFLLFGFFRVKEFRRGGLKKP
ncbi:MAG: hypothetical protein V2G43_05950 [bacterium JZ-2024 1]